MLILWRLSVTILNGVIRKNDFDLLTSGDLDQPFHKIS